MHCFYYNQVYLIIWPLDGFIRLNILQYLEKLDFFNICINVTKITIKSLIQGDIIPLYANKVNCAILSVKKYNGKDNSSGIGNPVGSRTMLPNHVMLGRNASLYLMDRLVRYDLHFSSLGPYSFGLRQCKYKTFIIPVI